MSIAQTPYPDSTFPVIAPAADPMNSALAQSGQTSRPVIVFANGSRILRPQSGQPRPDSPTVYFTLIIGWPARRRRSVTKMATATGAMATRPTNALTPVGASQTNPKTVSAQRISR